MTGSSSVCFSPRNLFFMKGCGKLRSQPILQYWLDVVATITFNDRQCAWPQGHAISAFDNVQYHAAKIERPPMKIHAMVYRFGFSYFVSHMTVLINNLLLYTFNSTQERCIASQVQLV